MIDVDDLKSINKEYGPLEGDKVLVATAFALKALAAEYDFYIARFDAVSYTHLLICSKWFFIGKILVTQYERSNR